MMKLNTAVKLIRISRLNGEDTREIDEDLQVTTITHITKDRKRTNGDHAVSESEFEIVNIFSARMKSLRGK